MEHIFAQQIIINISGMTILLLWSIGNIIYGTIKTRKLPKSLELYYFWKMAVIWNIVNLSIATFALVGVFQPGVNPSDREAVLGETRTLANILLSNIVLDWFYMLGGFLLARWGLRKSSLKLTGYGKSVILQGLFLLLLDIVLYAVNVYFYGLFSKA